MEFLKNKKLAVVLFLIMVCFLAIPVPGYINGSVAFAQERDPYAIPDAPAGASNRPQSSGQQPTTQTNEETAKNVGGLLYIATEIASKIITLISGLITFTLDIGNDVINLPVVLLGSQIVLNFANLGFVLAIIVIAFATIFQLQSYAMKQTLWKLIVAALLVNFSFFIAGGFIDVSNIFTQYFLRAATPQDLGTVLADALAPQNLAAVKDASFWDLASGGFSWVLQYISSLFFVLIFTLLIVITFAALFIMLLIRAIYLAILLIIMPIVWLLWIFPYTKSHWEKWWADFIRWVFFAPVMLFFIYLVVATQKQMANSRLLAQLDGLDASTAFTSNLTVKTGFVGHVAQLIIIAGLLMGGLVMANKIGIAGGKAAYGAGEGMLKGFGNWAGRKGARIAGYPFAPGRTPGPITNRIPGYAGLQSVKTRFNTWLAGNRLTRPLANLGGAYRGPKKHKNFYASVIGGATSGSGLFKKTKHWKCQNCGNVVSDKGRPSYPCPRCGVPASAPAGAPAGTPIANWQEI